MPRPTILLTGASGFVGRQIHRALVARGHAVTAIVREQSIHKLAAPARSIVVDDVFARSREWWERTCAGSDTVVHAAWHVVPGTYLTAPENLACVSGSLALAQGARAAGVGHVVGIGTCFEYDLPSDELTVESRLRPTTLYACAKASLFALLDRYYAETDVTFSWARLFYLYGEGEAEGRLVPSLRSRLSRGEAVPLSDGNQIRDFLDVREAGEMVATLVETRQPGVVNICSGRPITIRALAEGIADQYGRRDLLRFGALPPRLTDPSAVVGRCNLMRRAG